jgi:hypothetical protein
LAGIIDSQTDCGGWPELKSAVAPQDSDNDGMPDAWEKANKLNPDDATDAVMTAPSGYTWIEEYCHSLVR